MGRIGNQRTCRDTEGTVQSTRHRWCSSPAFTTSRQHKLAKTPPHADTNIAIMKDGEAPGDQVPIAQQNLVQPEPGSPSGPKSAQLKSSLSFMLTLIDVRCSTRPICSAIPMNLQQQAAAQQQQWQGDC